MMMKKASPPYCPLVHGELPRKTICSNNQLKQELIKGMRQELKGSRGLPWPPEPVSPEGNDHRGPALRCSLLILIMELRKNGLEVEESIYSNFF